MLPSSCHAMSRFVEAQYAAMLLITLPLTRYCRRRHICFSPPYAVLPSVRDYCAMAFSHQVLPGAVADERQRVVLHIRSFTALIRATMMTSFFTGARRVRVYMSDRR